MIKELQGEGFPKPTPFDELTACTLALAKETSQLSTRSQATMKYLDNYKEKLQYLNSEINKSIQLIESLTSDQVDELAFQSQSYQEETAEVLKKSLTEMQSKLDVKSTHFFSSVTDDYIRLVYGIEESVALIEKCQALRDITQNFINTFGLEKAILIIDTASTYKATQNDKDIPNEIITPVKDLSENGVETLDLCYMIGYAVRQRYV